MYIADYDKVKHAGIGFGLRSKGKVEIPGRRRRYSRPTAVESPFCPSKSRFPHSAPVEGDHAPSYIDGGGRNAPRLRGRADRPPPRTIAASPLRRRSKVGQVGPPQAR